MQILRHLESQLKYIVIETEHLFPSGLHVTKATLQGLQSSISERSSTLSCHYSFNLKGISDCKCCNAGLPSSSFRFSPPPFRPVFFFSFALSVFFPLIFLHYGCVSSPSVACLRLKERFSNYVQTIILDICR